MRAFASDGSSKSILVDEKMCVGQVCTQLADKNHVRLNHNLAVVEHMPELLMGEWLVERGRSPHPAHTHMHGVLK